MELRLQRVYFLSVEEPGDYIFVPSGVVIVAENNRFTIYCQSSSHNRFRAAINKHTWAELEKGSKYMDAEYRLTDETLNMSERGWRTTGSVEEILNYFYTTNTKYLYFLQKYLPILGV